MVAQLNLKDHDLAGQLVSKLSANSAFATDLDVEGEITVRYHTFSDHSMPLCDQNSL